MIYALIVWGAVAHSHFDWHKLADFESAKLCHEAAKELQIEHRYRCIRTKS